MSPTSAPHLIHFRVSHYNEKVRWALDFKSWPHTREAVIPGFHVPRVRWLTGQNQVPVLILDGVPLCGSTAIIEEIERRRPEPSLFPEAPELRARALEVVKYFDDEVAPSLRRLFWSCYLDRPADCAKMATMGGTEAERRRFRSLFFVFRPSFRHNMKVDKKALAAARERLPEYLARLESEIGPSGYLVGDRFGVADLSVAAVMTALLRPPEFPYPLSEPWPPALVELRASIADHPASQWVMDIYRRHRGTSSEIAA